MAGKINVDEVQEPLVRQVGELMLPLAEILQSVSIGHVEVNESFKRAAVEAARRRLIADGIEPTKSRIALICNMPRAEVARLYSTSTTKYEHKLCIGSQILDRWSTGKRWRDDNGPLVLPFKGIRSFSELCQSVTNRVHPNTILDEFETNHNVETLANGTIKFLNKQAIPSDKLALVSTGLNNIRHHLETFLANVQRPNSLYEQFIASEGIPGHKTAPVIQSLRRILADTNTRITRELEDVEIANMDFDTIGVGLYVYLKALKEK